MLGCAYISIAYVDGFTPDGEEARGWRRPRGGCTLSPWKDIQRTLPLHLPPSLQGWTPPAALKNASLHRQYLFSYAWGVKAVTGVGGESTWLSLTSGQAKAMLLRR